MASSQQTHLVVLHHGLWGNPSHMAACIKELLLADEESKQLSILNISVNEAEFSYDGVDVCGERTITVIKEALAVNPYINRISFIGYSLGGLILRYVVGILHKQGNFFTTINPTKYISIATPHLGIMKHSLFLGWMAGIFLARSGKQMALRDEYPEILARPTTLKSKKGGSQKRGEGGKMRPLLVIMSDPDLIFAQGLAQFEKISCFANIVNDRSVGYESAAIMLDNPFTKFGYKSIDEEKYPHIVTLDKETLLERPIVVQGTRVRMAIFMLILPIFLPFALMRTGINSYRSSIRSKNEAPSFTLLASTATSSTTTFAQEGEEEDANEVETLADTPASLEILDNLSKLNWTRVDCAVLAMNSHGSIISRFYPAEKKEAEHPFRDVLLFLASDFLR